MKPIKGTSVKTRRKFDEMFKREAIQNWLSSDKSAAVIAQELGLHADRLYAWKKRFAPADAGGSAAAGATPGSVADLQSQLEAVRDVEKRLEFFSKPDPREWKPETQPGDIAAPKGEPGDHQEHVRLMLDLIALAFWTDSTRIGTFMFANDVSGKNFGKLIPGAGGGHHEFSHNQDKAEKFEPYTKINRWHNEQLAYLMDKLKAIKEGERTLLDNSMVLFGSSMSDGNRHDPANLPVILAGRGGGKLKPRRHIASPKARRSAISTSRCSTKWARRWKSLATAPAHWHLGKVVALR